MRLEHQKQDFAYANMNIQIFIHKCLMQYYKYQTLHQNLIRYIFQRRTGMIFNYCETTFRNNRRMTKHYYK